MSQANGLVSWVGSERGSARVVAITGGKGGVGKTNLSIGMALTAASMGREVILMDGDLGLANIDVLLNFEAELDLSHVISGQAELEDVLVEFQAGLRVLPGASGITRLADLTGFGQERLTQRLEKLEDLAELILIDTGAGISRQVVDF